MVLDPHTLAAAFVLLSAMLSALLFFAWRQNRKIQALAWWSGTFGLVPVGIGMANLGQGVPHSLPLFMANGLVALGYGLLYAGCRIFNGRSGQLAAAVLGPGILTLVFPAVHADQSARIVLISAIAGGYASLAGWELWRHAPQRLVAQRVAIVLLFGLAAFNLLRGTLGLSLSSVLQIDTLASRWSAEMALLLVVYAPALAFIFVAMAKERTEMDYRVAEQALRESEEHYRYSVELSPQIPWTADARANILTASSRWHELTGMPVEEALGIGWTMALHPEDLAQAQQQWLHSTSTGRPFDAEYRVRLVDGNYRWFRARATARYSPDGTVFRWYGTLEDIHDSKLAAEHLRWAAYHDDLTGLPNRRLFQEHLQQALDQADRTRRRVGLLIIDLDDFKQVNDRYGHDAGDNLLREFGRCLVRLVRPTDTVARLGGDEFAVILNDIETDGEIAATARAIQSPIAEMPGSSCGARECRTSIGGAISIGPGMAMDELLKRADLALYGSKHTGRGTFTMFVPTLREEAQKTASALEMARNAVASDWIMPFYQPKVMLASGALVGFEALLRWRHPRAGLQGPDTLAPAFGDRELGTAVGERMLSCVLGDMQRWLDAGLDFGRIAVNVSPAEFRRDDYAERVLEHLRRAGISPSRLEVEITETVLLENSAGSVEATLRALCDAGVTIALDDFGTGYASLSHLKLFPVDLLKVDRSFISNMQMDTDDAEIVRAVVSLGHNLGIKVIAEGVERAAQASLLQEYGCDMVQGYHFGRPMPAEDVPQFLATWSDDTGHLKTGAAAQNGTIETCT